VSEAPGDRRRHEGHGRLSRRGGHDYQRLSLDIVAAIVTRDADDLLAFTRIVLARYPVA